MPDIRELTRDDLPEVARRLQAEYPRDGLTLANLHRKLFRDPDYRPELNLAAWRGERLAGVLLGVARGTNAYVKTMTTAPDLPAAEALLSNLESRVRSLGATELHATGSAPSYFLPGIDPTDTTTLSFYLDHGFQRTREVFNMTAPLDRAFDVADDEAGAAAAGYPCRPASAADAEALGRFLTETFSAGWATETLAALEDEGRIHLAGHEGRIVAFAAAEATNPGWFGPMGTHPDHRRHGLGRILLLRCLNDLRDLGYREAQIGWVGPLGFYARHCGARVSRVFWMLRKGLVTS